jgi:hypothetical protein
MPRAIIPHMVTLAHSEHWTNEVFRRNMSAAAPMSVDKLRKVADRISAQLDVADDEGVLTDEVLEHVSKADALGIHALRSDKRFPNQNQSHNCWCVGAAGGREVPPGGRGGRVLCDGAGMRACARVPAARHARWCAARPRRARGA